MKELIIIRHSKAEVFDFNKIDFDRKLTEKGKEDAQELAKYLKSHIKNIELILSSPAKRTFKTAKIIAKTIDYPIESIVPIPSIYESHYLNILKLISSQDAKFNRILLCGHNPGLEDFCNYVVEKEAIQLKTSGMIHLVFNIEHWIECSENTAIIIDKKNVG